ncbi:MAG: deoxyribonuclease IV [Alphaproteobacteria bacterium]|nr:deoxyribonuclease IV [Alphaproteobacteria bacterium]
MLNIGCHLSSSKGFVAMAKNAFTISASTFQFFTRNPQGSKAKDLDLNDIEEFLKIFSDKKIVAHAPYTLNPCSDNPKTAEFAELVFKDDLSRMELIPNNYYNFHPGSHVGQGAKIGIDKIASLLDKIIMPNQTTTILLETMSGKGSEVGATFEELQEIIKQVELPEKIGVCLDTCHVYSAGYDIVNQLDSVLEKFDKIIGLEKLKAIHLNDSKTEFNSHKDRHEQIGKGTIGLDTFVNIINHKKLKHLPFILETPNDLSGWQQEIKLLKSLSK